MVEGEATQEPSAPEGASASPSEETPVAVNESAPPPAEATEAPAAEIPADASPSLDWSHLRGFQTVESPGEAIAARDDYPQELAKELTARASRFANAVDESIVLSSDGLMRWLGDPVARVVAGDTLLAPRAVLLADDSLAGEDRAKVETRTALWLGAHIRKVLGPLVALADGADLPEAARPLGAKIADALGVLERERVRADAKALDQTARGGLRKLGVRFGSHYIYVPILLKPAARGLCSLLWTLRRGAETGAERLLAFAAAGRTSFANEGLLSPDSYRVAGFRLCGERVVRVDIIERLSDLIRAAIPDHMRSGSRPASEAYGFVITSQMTSLTGCSGEAFSSILRSLGFESIKVSKAAYEAAHRRAPMEPIKPPAAEPSSQSPALEGATESSAEAPLVENAHEAAAEGDPETVGEASATAEDVAEGDAHETIAAACPEPEPTETALTEEPLPETTLADAAPETVAPDVAEAAPDEVLETEPGAEATASAEASETDSATSPALAVGENDEAETQGSTPSTAEAADPTAATEEAASPAESDSEEIEIWRPAPRRARPPQRPQGAARDASSHPGKNRDHHRRRGRPDAREPAEAAAASSPGAAPVPEPSPRPAAERRDEETRRPHFKGKDDARPREDRRPNRDFQSRREPRPVQVDPDSPFAKLAALKPLLERRDKRP